MSKLISVKTKDMNDTYAGGVIQTKHEMRLIVKTPNCVTDPTIIVPLRIGNKPPTKTGVVSNTQIYGSPAQPPSLPQLPMIMGANQDGDVTVLPSAPPAGWSNPIISSSLAVPDSDIRVGGFESGLNQTFTSSISFDGLLAEMDRSLSDLDIVTNHSNDPDWDPLLRTLTPLQLGQLISKVSIIMIMIELLSLKS
jgi:hypothetical protein